MFITRIREDLKERFQEDYKKIKWFLILQICLFASMILLMDLSVLPFSRKYFWWVVPNPIVPLFLILISILSLPMEKKYDIRKRLKGSLYSKWLIILLVILFGLFIYFGLLTDQSISEAAQDFGKEIQVPTAFPFKVKDSSGQMFFDDDELVLDYEDNSHTLGVTIKPNKPIKLEGKVITLNNGDKAWLDITQDPDFPDDHSLYLDWYHDHIWYSLYLENEKGEFTEQDIINVSNSFRDLNSSNQAR